MEVTFDKSFSKSLDKINDKIILKRIEKAILQCELASELNQISNLKKWLVFKISSESKLAITELE